MRKLADISAFESLVSSPVSSISVFNRLNGEHPIDKAVMRLDWEEFEHRVKGADDEIDGLVANINELGVSIPFLLIIQQIEENNNSEESWWERFKDADKEKYWSWLSSVRRKKEKEFEKAEQEDAGEYSMTAEEAYREAKRMSLMETGRFDEDYDVEPLDEYYDNDSSDRYLN